MSDETLFSAVLHMLHDKYIYDPEKMGTELARYLKETNNNFFTTGKSKLDKKITEKSQKIWLKRCVRSFNLFWRGELDEA